MCFSAASAESLGFANRLLDATEGLGKIDLPGQFAKQANHFVSIRLISKRKLKIKRTDRKRAIPLGSRRSRRFDGAASILRSVRAIHLVDFNGCSLGVAA